MKFFLAVASLFFAAQIALANEEYADNTLGDPGAKIMLARAIEGDGDAILKVAVAYAAGDKGFPKNLNKAVLWWKKGADMGDAHSQNYLASAYLKGEGVEKNAERAIELWRNLNCPTPNTISVYALRAESGASAICAKPQSGG